MPPGPISNECLFEKVPIISNPVETSKGKYATRIKRGLIVNKDYRGVNHEVWTILLKMYGGGPQLVRDDPIDIYSRDMGSEFTLHLNNKKR